MLKFYYHPLSPIARRVWLSLLEKELLFEPILVNLAKGEQKRSSYLELNPFHHVPTLIDGELKIIESLAILDYLEVKYPTPSLTPESASEIAKMRMVQMVIVNEAVPIIPSLVVTKTPETNTTERVETVLRFLSEHLGNSTYFGGEQLNLADIVAGATIPLLCRLGISISSYTNLTQWYQQIESRDAWKKTEPKEEDFRRWRHYIQLLVKQKTKK